MTLIRHNPLPLDFAERTDGRLDFLVFCRYSTRKIRGDGLIRGQYDLHGQRGTSGYVGEENNSHRTEQVSPQSRPC